MFLQKTNVTGAYRPGAGGRRSTTVYETDGLTVGTAESVGVARAYARDTLSDWGLTALEDTVTLLVSEMVTNSLLHTPGPARLSLRRDGNRLRITVCDDHPEAPRPAPSLDAHALHGRGLLLVDALADAWGAERLGEGKRVWAVVAISS
jgi:anti-sigma regulatory factor (Ser/Thr protein kinase)